MSEGIEPGSWHEHSKNEVPPRQLEVNNELKAASHEDLVAKYRVFRESTGTNPKVVYHPCSAVDSSPSVAFPESRVIYAERDERAVKALQEAGLEAHYASALEFNPGNVDMLILLNPAIEPDFPSQFVVPGGYVVSNDYHGTATSLRNNDQFELQGIIRQTRDKGLLLDRDNPDDYWKEVETEEEWENAPFTWGGAVNYSSAAEIVELVTGKRENIMEEYRRIVEMAREDGLAIDANTFIYTYQGRSLVLSFKLPSKKGTVDDLFVFQKAPKEDISAASPDKDHVD